MKWACHISVDYQEENWYWLNHNLKSGQNMKHERVFACQFSCRNTKDVYYYTIDVNN